MSPDLFQKLKELDDKWKYEICVGSNGFVAKLKEQGSQLSMMKTGKSMDELALWILSETDVTREA